MTSATFDPVRQRLVNQRLARAGFRTAADVVAWLGAVQAQDYAAAKWALGLRARGLTDAAVDQALDEGAILRTHVMRPTWHFVTPADIRWILMLTAPRVHAANAPYYVKVGLEAATFARSGKTLERALRGRQHLTRTELASVLARAGIIADGMRLAYLMMHAELDAVICSGPRQGKQFTYALLDERAPGAMTLTHDEALGQLTRRYFASHGPATPRDYAWWSGLTMRQAQTGVEMIATELQREIVEDRTYWFIPPRAAAIPAGPSAHLLPNYDEYLIAYKDRDLVAAAQTQRSVGSRRGDTFAHHLIIDGLLAGSWMRTVGQNSVVIDVAPYARLTSAQIKAVSDAAERYSRFMGMRDCRVRVEDSL